MDLVIKNVVEERKRDKDVSKNHLKIMVNLVLLHLSLLIAILSLVQLIVRYHHGLFGQNVTRRVEEESLKERGQLKLNLNLMVSLVLLLIRLKIVISCLVQLIVRFHPGVIGLHVLLNVEEEQNQEIEKYWLNHNMVVKPVLHYSNQQPVTLTHVLLIVKLVHLEHGQNVTKNVEVECNQEQEMLQFNQRTMERFVLHLRKHNLVIQSLVSQQIVQFLLGLYPVLVIRYVEEERFRELEEFLMILYLVVKNVLRLKNIFLAIRIPALLIVKYQNGVSTQNATKLAVVVGKSENALLSRNHNMKELLAHLLKNQVYVMRNLAQLIVKCHHGVNIQSAINLVVMVQRVG